MLSIRSSALLGAIVLSSLTAWSVLAAEKPSTAAGKTSLDHGRFLVQFGGCNDCHTPNYGPRDGKVPENEWLKGDSLGFQGPWGTTYPVNLRILLGTMNEDAWVKFAHNLHARPPMPSFNLNILTEADLRDMYRFIKSLGPGGESAPAYLPPGQKPTGPVVSWPGANQS